MCVSGDRVWTPVHVDSSVAHEGFAIVKEMPIDRCLVPLVRELDRRGIRMLSSCCGHGRLDGVILIKGNPEPITLELPRLTM